MDSVDMNTRLELSDTSSIPPMHGGFLLLSCFNEMIKPFGLRIAQLQWHNKSL